MGVIVLLNEAGIFAVPALYAPAGGVSGRTTLATVVWLVAWGLLHYRWKGREIATGACVGADVDPARPGHSRDLSAGLAIVLRRSR